MFKRMVVLGSLLLLALALAACGARVSQEEYDQVVTDLEQAEAEIARLEGELSLSQAEVESLRSEMETAHTDAAVAQEDLEELRAGLEDAKMASDMLEDMLQVALGGEASEQEAMALFLNLSEKVEASGDEELQTRFQAVIASMGGEQEAIELVQYLLLMINRVGEE